MQKVCTLGESVWNQKRGRSERLRYWLCLLLAFCFAVSGISFSAADQAQDEAAVHGVDAVVVLDMTNSMTGQNSSKGNDEYGYRLDATAMLIGMLDMNGSRVAIVPFAGTPTDMKVWTDLNEWTELNELSSRTELINKIRKNNSTRGNTNIGAALMRANKILSDREDTSNQPMIVLLTDGVNDIATGSDALRAVVNPDYRWNETTQEIEERSSQRYDTALADIVTKEAVECAKAKGYPIYTVALKTDPREEPAGGISLNDISRETGVSMGAQQANPDTVDQLPGFFANVLADKIGSTVQMTMKPINVGENTYEVLIPIVNESIQETNIIVPVLNRKSWKTMEQSSSKIHADTIRVLNGDKEAGEPTVTKLYGNEGFFAMIKIKNPKMTSSWKLQFESDEDPSSITFNLLYNYDIKLAANVTNENDSEEFYKNNPLKIEARFVDTNGTPSTDSELYKDHPDVAVDYKSWARIVASYSLYPVDEDGQISDDASLRGEMEANSVQNFFHHEIDLLRLPQKLKAGNYLLRVETTGAGLARQVDIPLTLKNHEPYAKDYEETIHVNPVGSEERWDSASTSGQLAKALNQIVTDEDDDELEYDKLKQVGDPAAVMKLTANAVEFITKEENGKVQPGDAEYELYYTDNEIPQPKKTRLVLHIVSDVDEMMKTYTPEVLILDPDDGDQEKVEFLKNNTLKVSVRLKDKKGEYAGEDLIEKISGTVKILKNGEEWREEKLSKNGNTLEYITKTENQMADLAVQVELKYYGPLEEKSIQVKGGHAPVGQAREKITLNREGGQVPGFLKGLIGENTAEDDPSLTVDLKTAFTDVDGDELKFGTPTITEAGSGRSVSSLTAEPVDGEEDVYQIQYVNRTTSLFHYSYDCVLTATATDGDGETGRFNQTITVVDLYYKMLTQLVLILIGIAILVIICLIIHQIRKPVFPMLNMTIREEPSLYESGSETLSPVKTPTNLNAIGVDSDMAAKHNISMDLLQNTIVKPIRSISSVSVSFKKEVPGHEVMLDDVQMKAKKWYTWRIGQELTVQSLSGEGLIAVKLEDRQEENDGNDMSDFGKEDDWTSTGFEDGVSSAGKKRKSHRVEKKKPAQQTEQKFQGGSSDDFDF